jgi:hypothetical protein
MSKISPLATPQPQLAQLEVLFSGPLVKDSLVGAISDLIELDVNYNYSHRLVWVKEAATFYYLDNGTGSELSNWIKLSSRVVITKYSATSTYQTGDCVFLNRKIYSAIQAVPVGYNPLDYEDYWLCITGESETYRYLFTTKSSVILYTEIRNPKFEVILGDFEYESDGVTIKYDSVTGLASLTNTEIIEAFVKKREDLDNDNGVPYEISFFADDTTTTLTGCINVK